MADDHRGILNPQAGFEHFTLHRRAPAPDLAPFVDRFWLVAWDLRGREPYTSEILPHPSFHLVVEDEGTFLYGVGASRFERRLEGHGSAVGLKFLPGGAFPFLRTPAWRFTNRSLPAAEAFGAEVPRREDRDAQVAAVEDFLRARLPEPDPQVAFIGAVVATMSERSALTVEAVAARHDVSARTLQRLFRRYVGVSPKWVLQRFRLHEAAERVDAIGADDAAATAIDLGYFDQAHFINDFRDGVGQSPGRYAKGKPSKLAGGPGFEGGNGA
jgi:AraC-like DNA-binding protein